MTTGTSLAHSVLSRCFSSSSLVCVFCKLYTFSCNISHTPAAIKASLPFGWYSLRLPTKGWPGWVDLGGWSHTEINVPHRELNPDMVTHSSTNRARRRVTSLMCAARVRWAFQVSQGSVETLFRFRWGGKRLHDFAANLLRK